MINARARTVCATGGARFPFTGRSVPKKRDWIRPGKENERHSIRGPIRHFRSSFSNARGNVRNHRCPGSSYALVHIYLRICLYTPTYIYVHASYTYAYVYKYTHICTRNTCTQVRTRVRTYGGARRSATARVYTLHMYTLHTTYVHCVTPIRQRAAPNEPK